MMKKLISIVVTLFVMLNVIAGGDDRDQGPVESLDSVLEMEPVTDKVVVGELEAQTMTLTNTEDEALAQELAEFEARLAEEARLADLEWRAEFEAQLAEQARLAEVIATTESGVEITVAAHESCQETLGLSDYNIDKFITSLAAGRLYNEGPQLELGTLFSPHRWDQYFDCVEKLSK